jgi:DNA gyrase/topoisomerase IV subunit A
MEHQDFTNLPVYKKALEIFKVSRAIAYNIGNGEHIIEMSYATNENKRMAGEIVTASLQLAPALAALQNSSCTNLQLKKANTIRKSAQKIMAKCRKMEYLSKREKEILILLKKEIKQFESLFSQWYHQLEYRNRP